MRILLAVLFCGFCLKVVAQSDKTEILILGSDHLSQVYREGHPNTDILTPKNQTSIQAFSASVEKYKPDMIMVEVLPEEQDKIDSLYALYLANKLDLEHLEYGRSEVYQLAFRIGKNTGVKQIVCVNSKGGTSQSILDNGDNIEIYNEETKELRQIVMKKYAALDNGELSFQEFLTFLNQAEAYNKLYRLKYMTPARVTNGTFSNPDEMVDTAFVNPKYIGAELISVFKNRDYKIYSNIVTQSLKQAPQRILLIIGVGHIGSLKSIFRDDEDFSLIDANNYLIN